MAVFCSSFIIIIIIIIIINHGYKTSDFMYDRWDVEIRLVITRLD